MDEPKFKVGDRIILIHYCPRTLNAVIEIPAMIMTVGKARVRVDTEHRKGIVVPMNDIKNET